MYTIKARGRGLFILRVTAFVRGAPAMISEIIIYVTSRQYANTNFGMSVYEHTPSNIQIPRYWYRACNAIHN